MITIYPKHYGTYDCYLNNVIGPVSEFWNTSHLPVLWAESNFVNHSDAPRNFEDISIGVGSREMRSTIWKDYCGISLKACRYNDFQDFQAIIIENLRKNTPLAVTLGSNHVPWNTYLQTRPHCLLICGVDENGSELLCCDGIYHAKGLCKIDIRYLFQHYFDILQFQQHKTEQISFDHSLQYFVQVLRKNNNRKADDLNIFVGNIKHCWECGQFDTLSAEVSQSNFLLDLTEVCNSRHNFMKGMQFFCQEFETDLLVPLMAELYELSKSWDIFKGLYVKIVFSMKKSYFDKAVALLEKIVKWELDFDFKLIQCCEEKVGRL